MNEDNWAEDIKRYFYKNGGKLPPMGDEDRRLFLAGILMGIREQICPESLLAREVLRLGSEEIWGGPLP